MQLNLHIQNIHVHGFKLVTYLRIVRFMFNLEYLEYNSFSNEVQSMIKEERKVMRMFLYLKVKL